MGEGRTFAAINSTGAPTAAFVKNPNWQFPGAQAEQDIRTACGSDHVEFIDAGQIATVLMGDNIATNMFMLGYAWQKGHVPLSEAAIMKAIELNGVSVEFNKNAFIWGRNGANDLAALVKMTTPAQVIELKRAPTLDEIVKKRVASLTDYQNAEYAAQYTAFVDEVRAAESKLGGKTLRLTEAVARYYYKLMAYKDEYEVARLHSNGVFAAKIADMFEGEFKVKYHLAPPLFSKRDTQGHLIKKEFGSWMKHGFTILAKLKGLRGTALDIFGYTAERKMERALIVEYRQMVSALLPKLTAENLTQAVAIASIPEDIRGYGHVKERHFDAAKRKQDDLLVRFHNPGTNAAAVHITKAA